MLYLTTKQHKNYNFSITIYKNNSQILETRLNSALITIAAFYNLFLKMY